MIIGKKNFSQKQTYILHNTLNRKIKPELEELVKKVEKGDAVEKHPELRDIVDNLEAIKKKIVKMEEAIEKTCAKTSVEGFLKKTGYKLNVETLEKLESINDACNKIIQAEEERNRYKAENNFSILNIVSMSDVAGDTVYNHDFYKEFIEYKKKDYVEKLAAARIKELETQVARLRTENGQLHQRDGEFIDLKRENKRLKKELERIKKKYTESMS